MHFSLKSGEFHDIKCMQSQIQHSKMNCVEFNEPMRLYVQVTVYVIFDVCYGSMKKDSFSSYL